MRSTSISGALQPAADVSGNPHSKPELTNSLVSRYSLDEDYIVFRGGESEAASAHLSGKLILCLSEPLSIKHIRLHLTGISRVWYVVFPVLRGKDWALTSLLSWHLPSSSAGGGRKSWRERVIYEKTWRFRDPGKGKTEILPAGNYEYPINLVLEGSMPESVEGLSDTYITYRFKAEIGRKYAKDIIVRKPLRIIRTLEPSALELAHAMVSDTPSIRCSVLNH
jgi:hypothetical protein